MTPRLINYTIAGLTAILVALFAYPLATTEPCLMRQVYSIDAIVRMVDESMAAKPDEKALAYLDGVLLILEDRREFLRAKLVEGAHDGK